MSGLIGEASPARTPPCDKAQQTLDNAMIRLLSIDVDVEELKLYIIELRVRVGSVKLQSYAQECVSYVKAFDE